MLEQLRERELVPVLALVPGFVRLRVLLEQPAMERRGTVLWPVLDRSHDHGPRLPGCS